MYAITTHESYRRTDRHRDGRTDDILIVIPRYYTYALRMVKCSRENASHVQYSDGVNKLSRRFQSYIMNFFIDKSMCVCHLHIKNLLHYLYDSS